MLIDSSWIVYKVKTKLIYKLSVLLCIYTLAFYIEAQTRILIITKMCNLKFSFIHALHDQSFFLFLRHWCYLNSFHLHAVNLQCHTRSGHSFIHLFYLLTPELRVKVVCWNLSEQSTGEGRPQWDRQPFTLTMGNPHRHANSTQKSLRPRNRIHNLPAVRKQH